MQLVLIMNAKVHQVQASVSVTWSNFAIFQTAMNADQQDGGPSTLA